MLTGISVDWKSTAITFLGRARNPQSAEYKITNKILRQMWNRRRWHIMSCCTLIYQTICQAIITFHINMINLKRHMGMKALNTSHKSKYHQGGWVYSWTSSLLTKNWSQPLVLQFSTTYIWIFNREQRSTSFFEADNSAKTLMGCKGFCSIIFSFPLVFSEAKHYLLI